MFGWGAALLSGFATCATSGVTVREDSSRRRSADAATLAGLVVSDATDAFGGTASGSSVLLASLMRGGMDSVWVPPSPSRTTLTRGEEIAPPSEPPATRSDAEAPRAPRTPSVSGAVGADATFVSGATGRAGSAGPGTSSTNARFGFVALRTLGAGAYADSTGLGAGTLARGATRTGSTWLRSPRSCGRTASDTGSKTGATGRTGSTGAGVLSCDTRLGVGALRVLGAVAYAGSTGLGAGTLTRGAALSWAAASLSGAVSRGASCAGGAGGTEGAGVMAGAGAAGGTMRTGSTCVPRSNVCGRSESGTVPTSGGITRTCCGLCDASGAIG